MLATQIAGAIAEPLTPPIAKMTFSLDLSSWQPEHIRQLLDLVIKEVDAKGFKVRGARVSSDLFTLLGGTQAGYENARFHNSVPLVVTPTFGYIEIDVERR